MSSKLLSLTAALLLGAGAARAAEPGTYAFTRQSTASYHVMHPMHHVVGVSHDLAGEVRVAGSEPDLVLPLRLSIPIRSFESGNRNRDRNMLQVMHAARYPNALLEIQSVRWSKRLTEGPRTTVEGTATGDLTLNGLMHPVDLRLDGFTDGDRLEVHAAFSFLLHDYSLERPSLLFRPVDDEVKLEIEGIALRR